MGLISIMVREREIKGKAIGHTETTKSIGQSEKNPPYPLFKRGVGGILNRAIIVLRLSG